MNRVVLDTSSLRRRLEARAHRADDRSRELLEKVGERTVKHLRSYTAERTEDGRFEHPGGWGDRTGILAESYDYEVSRGPSGWQLTILNDAPHAHLLEGLEGYFVVRGVTDPGGPVEDALRRAVRDVAPEWSFRRK